MKTEHTPDSRTYRLVGSENIGFTLHAIIPEVGDSRRLASFSALDHGSADFARRVVDTLNACAGLNPAAIAEAVAQLETLLNRCIMGLDQSPTHDGLTNCHAISKARAALAKLKGQA